MKSNQLEIDLWRNSLTLRHQKRQSLEKHRSYEVFVIGSLEILYYRNWNFALFGKKEYFQNNHPFSDIINHHSFSDNHFSPIDFLFAHEGESMKVKVKGSQNMDE